MDWDDFRFVHAVAQTGSVRGAGELLKVHGATVARHLDQLEQRLGVKLFVRTPRGMQMTPGGAEVIGALDRVATELEAVERRLRRGPDARGPVRLTVARELAESLVVPLLADLYLDYPELDLVLSAAAGIDELERGEADIALCLTDDPPGDLVGRPLGRAMACAYTSSESLQGEDGGAPPTGRWVECADSLCAQVKARYFPELPAGLRLDDVSLRAGALEAGLGVGLLPCHVGDPRPGLVRAGAMNPVALGQVWLFSRQDSRGVARIQALSGFLQDLFVRHRRRLEGH